MANWIWPALLLVSMPVSPVESTNLPGCSYFLHTLDADQVVPPSNSQVFGWASLFLCYGDSLSGELAVDVPERVSAVHIHGPARPGQNGELLYELPLPDELGKMAVLIRDILAEQQNWFYSELCYIDIHSESYTDGITRGQMRLEVAVTEVTWAAVKQLFQ